MSEAIWFQETFHRIREQVSRVIIGQQDVVEDTLVALAAQGHVLLEGMPGLGKTLLVRTISQAVSLDFSRIQFTPDMMPADVTGTQVLVEDDSGQRHFQFRRGPVFGNVILADEINRATPKTQSALLEAMQEHAVTIGGQRHSLPEPFMVLATQNPVEQEGTYPLPEAQLDRFLMKVIVPSPGRDELAAIVKATSLGDEVTVEPVASPEELNRLRQIGKSVPVAERVLQFGLSLVLATHGHRYLHFGASPRGAQSLISVAQIYALLDARFNVSKEDIVRAALPTLRHRIGLNFEAQADGIDADSLLRELIGVVAAEDRDPVEV